MSVADGRNHVPCCVQEGIPDICQDVCQGEYTPITDNIKTMVSCSPYTEQTLACIVEGIGNKYLIILSTDSESRQNEKNEKDAVKTDPAEPSSALTVMVHRLDNETFVLIMFFTCSRDSAQSTGRRSGGGQQQFQNFDHVEQTVGQFGFGQRVCGQRDDAPVVRRHENVVGKRRQQPVRCHAAQHSSQGNVQEHDSTWGVGYCYRRQVTVKRNEIQ